MKITVEQHNEVISIETEYDDLDMYDFAELIKRLGLAMTYNINNLNEILPTTDN